MTKKTTILLARLAKTASLADSLIAKAKGITKQAVTHSVENGGSENRIYLVLSWNPSCKGCKKEGKCSDNKRECDSVKWFPLYNNVHVHIENNSITSALCRVGRKHGGLQCDKSPKCKHIERVEKYIAGLESKGVELSGVFKHHSAMPTCPNCKQKWGVKISHGEKNYECHNPVCVRENKSWDFNIGDENRPTPMRNELVIIDKEPGRTRRSVR